MSISVYTDTIIDDVDICGIKQNKVVYILQRALGDVFTNTLY